MLSSLSQFWTQYKQRVRLALGITITAVVVWWLVQDFDWGAVKDALLRARFGAVAVAVGLILLTAVTRVQRWRALLWPVETRFMPALRALLVGQVFNLVLPLRGGDVARAVLVGETEPVGAAEVLGSVALEKMWDLVMLLLCGFLFPLLMPLPSWFTQSTWGTLLIVLLGVGTLILVLRYQAFIFGWVERLLVLLPAGWDKAIYTRLQNLTKGLTAIQDARASLTAFLWSLATWGLGALVNLMVLWAFGLHHTAAALLLLVGLMLGNSAVPTPGRFGIFEGITVAVLALFDINPDTALAVGLLLHLVVQGPPLLFALVLSLGMESPWWKREYESA
jgi:uncharacterized protein (TIRG00374 family)